MTVGKAPGPDQIPTTVIKSLFNDQQDWFLKVMNRCLNEERFLNDWKIAKLIPKESKNPQDPSAYRPICLLPVWGKVLDKALTARITNHIEQNNLISDFQYGFRKN